MKNRNYSLLRQEQYRMLATLTFHGVILDLGGNKASVYHELMNGVHRIESANINPEYGCDFVFDVGEGFPLDGNAYNHIVCLNLLEHVYNFPNVIAESYRVLKHDGMLVLSVPFMHHIHASPDDYFRYTASALRCALVDVGFKEVAITELGFGLFSLIYQTIQGAVPRLIRPSLQRCFVGCDKLLLRLSGRYRAVAKRIPLGYFVVAKK
ncbi:MAG: methyltransferase domain-containing protein [Candidatus Sungbacteria bacterium]|nr:methyltransferase domain-containing protein [Candidatus Sungbacteria bacterium]